MNNKKGIEFDMRYVKIYTNEGGFEYGRAAKDGEKVTIKVDLVGGRVSFKVEDTDFGVAYTHQRFCSGDYYPAVCG